MIYMDSSALITLLTGRANASALEAFLMGFSSASLATCTVGFVETVRHLDRAGSFPQALVDLDTRVTEILLDREVRDLATRVDPGLRALDALHVASALSMEAELAAFVTYDRRMLDAARKEGLPSHAPGMPT
ncbi:MAG: type II toxin-antitoxin system VapC family toxin [Streptomyces sp.]|nr:type II toxin-antitoxin system VapC family toxin [Streptomyces sp.]NUS29940.1 type II toxin-antitoxin system VapC family toxin [Streptomyces sp.]NUS87018.1 type II toxin-antitoxin system VapC family toxin [Streptomyces sp.]